MAGLTAPIPSQFHSLIWFGRIAAAKGNFIMVELSTKRLVDYLNEPGIDAAILKGGLVNAGAASSEQGVKADTALQPIDPCTPRQSVLALVPLYLWTAIMNGTSTANVSSYIRQAVNIGGPWVVPAGLWNVDPLVFSKRFDIELAQGCELRLTSVPDFNPSDPYAADHAVVRATLTAQGSRLFGLGAVSGNREVTAAKWLAYPHTPTYGGGSYVIDQKSFGIWSDADDFFCFGLTIKNCIGGGLFSYRGRRQTWGNLTITACTKAYNLQSLTDSNVANIHAYNIQNKLLDGTPLPYWQHSFEMRDFDGTRLSNLSLSAWRPLINDNSGNLIGDDTPCAFVSERMYNCIFEGKRTDAYSYDKADSRAAARTIGISLSGCMGNILTVLRILGHNQGLLFNSSSGNAISNFLLDGLYNTVAGTDAVGLGMTPGGIGKLSESTGINPDYRLNAGSKDNIWSNGIIRRFKIGGLIQSADNRFYGVVSEANLADGWQGALAIPNTSFPGSVPDAPRRILLSGCSGINNGRSGVFLSGFESFEIDGGSYNNNGQDTLDGASACGVATFGAATLLGLHIDAEAMDTQNYLLSRNVSFPPGATDTNNQIQVRLMDSSRSELGQYILVKNGAGSADIKAKIVDVSNDTMTLQTAAPALFSSSGNLVALSGMISPTGDAVILQGTGTAFSSEIKGPAYGIIGGVTVSIAKVVDDTHIQLATAPSSPIAAGSSGRLILCDQQGIPSQRQGVHVVSAVQRASVRISGGDKNIDRAIGFDSLLSFVEGQKLDMIGNTIDVSTTGVDSAVLPTISAELGWIVTGYRFQVTQQIVGPSTGSLSLILGRDDGYDTLAIGIGLAKNSKASGAAQLYTPKTGMYPIARISGHDVLPTSGKIRCDLLITKAAPNAFSDV